MTCSRKRLSTAVLVMGAAAALPATATAALPAEAGVAAQTRAVAVGITVKEWSMRASPASVQAGKVTFAVRNAGRRTHQFVLLRTRRSPSALPMRHGRVRMLHPVARIAAVRAGHLRRVTVSLTPGRYVVFCNLRGHYRRSRHNLPRFRVTRAGEAVGQQSGGAEGTDDATLGGPGDPGVMPDTTFDLTTAGPMAFNRSQLTAWAGKVTLRFTNGTPIPHNVAIKGNGITPVLGTVVGLNGVSTASAVLAPGVYRFYCSVEDHEQAGMWGTLTIVERTVALPPEDGGGGGGTTGSAPSAPTALGATAGNASVSLVWQASSDTDGDLAGYRVYRSSDGSSWSSTPIAATANTNYVDAGLVNDATYYYRVVAYDTAGHASAPSSVVSATPTVPPNPPSAPTVPGGLVATGAVGQVSLAWQASSDPDDDLVGYRIYRSPDGTAWSSTPIASTAGTGYVDTNVLNGTTYYYRLTAYDAADNESAPSSIAVASASWPQTTFVIETPYYPTFSECCGYLFDLDPGPDRNTVIASTLDPPLSAPAGEVSITMRNYDGRNHNVAIKKSDGSGGWLTPVAAGPIVAGPGVNGGDPAISVATAILDPGEYRFYCQVGTHENLTSPDTRAQRGTLIVTAG